MIFTNLLYIFQSEHYDRKRFLRFVYSTWRWHSLADRGSIEWTLRSKILFVLSNLFLIADILFVSLFTQNIVLLGGAFVLMIVLFPFYLLIADFVLAPFLQYKKTKILEKAQKIIAKAKSARNLQVIGITGSYGKTSCKNIVETLFSTQFLVLTIPGNINTELGVANYLIKNAENLSKIDFLLVEMGAYTTGEIQKICDIVSPEYSFLTAVAPVHIERFGSLENTFLAKFELPNSTQKVSYLNFQNNNILNRFQEFFSGKNPSAKIGNIQQKDAELEKIFTNREYGENFSGISFSAEYKGELLPFKTKLISDYIFEFLAMIFPFAEKCNISPENLQKGIASIDYTPHRLEVIKNPHTGVTVIDDSYNGNFSGFVAGLNALGRATGRKVVLTPGIVELGDLQEKVHTDLADLYREKLDLVLLVQNSNTKIIEQNFLKNNFTQYKKYPDVHAAHADLANVLKKGDTILFQNDLSDNYL
jgi:UDP-N-acetylmuramoyl-tripeptide--D-alanyl-D-alanine ligase